MLSMSSQTATVQSTPHYVAELTESQPFVADIPPLVNSLIFDFLFTAPIFDIFLLIGTCSL